jgi:hypothetical protein
MPLIEVTTSAFVPPHQLLNGVRDEDWSVEELLHAAMTTGKLPQHLLAHGQWSVMELVSRASLVFANLGLKGRRYVQSDAYRFSDRSEKAATSYYFGQTLAGLFAERYLNTPYVMGVDRYLPNVGVVWSHPRKRPDLIGWGAVGWVVIEAKGRTNGLDATVMQNAIAQKNTVATIGGAPPGLRVAAAAHFSSGALAMHVVDPPLNNPPDEPSEELPGDVNSFLRTYYSPFVEAATSGADTQVRDRRARLVTVPGFDLQVGVEVEVIDAFTTSESALRGTADRFARERDRTPVSEGARVAHRDGIIVEAGSSWSEEQLTRQPWERGR